MDIRKLEILLDLAETRNFSVTAEKFFTTQGNISKQLKKLEQELNVQLFDRTHRQIELTAAGKLTLPHARQIVTQSQQLITSLNNYQTQATLSLTLYTIPTMPHYQSFSIITTFLNEHPEVIFQLIEDDHYELATTSFDDPNSEIAFTRTFDSPISNLEMVTTETDSFVAILPKTHPLAQQSIIELQALKNEKFLLLGPTTSLYKTVLGLFKTAGFTPTITYEGTRIGLLLNMAANNLGIAITTKKTAEQMATANVALVPITPNQTSQLSFVRRTGAHTKASDLFWQFLKDQVSQLDKHKK